MPRLGGSLPVTAVSEPTPPDLAHISPTSTPADPDSVEGSPTSSATADSDLASDPEQERHDAFKYLAIELEAETDCVVDQFTDVPKADLEAAGIEATGLSSTMWSTVLSDLDGPVFGPLMLATSFCTDQFDRLTHETLWDLLPSEEIDCIVRNGRSDPNLIALYTLGTIDGAEPGEEMMVKLMQGVEVRNQIIAVMRALGECPAPDIEIIWTGNVDSTLP